MKKWLKQLSALVLAAVMLIAAGMFTACAAVEPTESAVEPAAEPTALAAEPTSEPAKDGNAYREDFYQAVNADWLSKAVIPGNESGVSEFGDVLLLVEKQLKDDINAIAAGETPMPEDIPGFDNFVQYYRLNMDFEARENQGVEPMLPDLKRIESLKSMEEFTKMLPEWTLDDMPTPAEYTVTVDFKQADTNSLYLTMAESILPDVSYYDENKEIGDRLLETYKASVIELAVMAGKTQTEAETIADEALEYDRLLVPFLPTSLEMNDLENMYHPINVQDLASVNENLAEAGKSLVGKDVSQVILFQKKGAEGIAAALDSKNFQTMKSWMYAQALMDYGTLLTEEYRQISGQYRMALYGLEELTAKEKVASRNAFDSYMDPVGIYYGKTYLGEKGKEEVSQMTREFIATYRKSLEENTWLSKTTQAKALEKLDKMSVQMGYPDSVLPLYTKLTIVDAKQGGTLVSNTKVLVRKTNEYLFSCYATAVDKSEFIMPGYMVNAGYRSTANTICFPAAFLQGAMYSTEQSASANYGGIGVVIAHEISHAFDPNGAKFDADGNMKDWWTEKDYEKFEELSQKMVDQFDGIPCAGGKVNGNLTVGENVADLGGLSCALSVAKSKPDYDAKAFFENYATVWRGKRRPERQNMLLLTDPHSPENLRVNVQLPNFEEFHQTFSVQPGDAMYRAPEDRVSIW